MKRKAIYRLACATAALAVCAACAPARASASDERIESAFKNSYVYKTYLQDDAFQTEVKEGVVTLTGPIATPSHKALARETAASLPGVSRVEVHLAPRGDDPIDSEEAWVGRKVKLVLMFHRNVRGHKATVVVKNGTVTLTGEATSLAEKELTGAYAKDIEGVKRVKNEMTVATAPAEPTVSAKVDDASITSQVRLALRLHRSTTAVQTMVATREGVVTLTGTAKTEAEKALAGQLISDIQGVSSVQNEMTVVPVKTQ